MRDASPEVWRDLIAEHLDRAYATGDVDELASTIQFMAYLLDGEGRFDDAVEEVHHALRLAHAPGPARALLLVVLASLKAAMGQHDEAARAVDESEVLLEGMGEASPLKCLVLNETARLQLLMAPSPRLASLIEASMSGGSGSDHLFLLSWYIPWLAAMGRKKEVGPVLRQFDIQADHGQHRWRAADAETFHAWIEAVGLKPSEPEGGRGPNALASWRMASLRLWRASARHDLLQVQSDLQRIARVRPRLGTADLGPAEAWDAWFATTSGGVPAVGWLPPRYVTLVNLPAALVSAHAVATGGTPSDADIWLRWVKQIGRVGIESSLEWPVSRRRLEALLALRTGKFAQARSLMASAVDWAATAGFAQEAAIAQLQLARLSATGGAADRWQRSADEVRASLIAVGSDPLPHVVAVDSCLLTGHVRPSRPLTPRELEVLRVLVTGLTYRAVGEQLGIAGPTVQSFAHKIYEKLGVSGRQAAAVRAQELGLL